jgi:hypothetical protein
MTDHGSASTRKDAHLTDPQPNQPLSRALRQRAMRIINNNAIDPGTRAFIRYALDTNDPWTPGLVRRAESGEVFDENFNLTRREDEPVKELSIEYEAESQLDQTIDEKLEALTDLICRPGNEPDIKSGALLLLMATLESSALPKTLATTTKNFAFLRCCELNLFGMVDLQTELIEKELLRS